MFSVSKNKIKYKLPAISANIQANRRRFIRLFKESIWIVAGQAASVTGALVIVRILTEYLPPAEYGRLNLAMTISSFASQVVLGGIPNVTGRFYSIAITQGDFSGFLQAAIKYAVLATVAILILAFIPSFFLFLTGKVDWGWLVLICLLYSIVSAYGSGIGAIQNVARQRSLGTLHSALDALIKIIMAVCLIRVLGASSTSIAIGYLFSAVVIATSQLYFLKPLVKKLVKKQTDITGYSWLSKMWAYSWPFSIWGIFTGLQQASDRWALQTFTSSADVGLYAVVFQLGYTPITFLVGLVMSLILPILYQMTGVDTNHSREVDAHRIVMQIAVFGLLITLLAFIASLLLHEKLFQMLVSKSYRHASIYFPWMVLSGGLFAIGQVLSLKFMTDMQSKKLLSVKVGTAALGIVMNIVCVINFGVSGVVYSLLFFSVIYLFWMYLLTRKKTVPVNA